MPIKIGLPMPKQRKKPDQANAMDRLRRAEAQLDELRKAAKIDPMPLELPGRESPQFLLRYTAEMRDQIARLAKARGQSINTVIVTLLERALSYGDTVEQLETSMGEICDRVEKLEATVSEHDDQLNWRDPNPEK